MKHGYIYWHNLCIKRINSILKKYICCSHQQFQMKISEAGPTNQRIEPVVLSECIKEVVSKKKITFTKSSLYNRQEQKFYHYPNCDGRKLNPRIKKLIACLNTYIKVTQKSELCGNILEYIIGQSIVNSNLYQALIPIFTDTPTGVIKKSGLNTEIITFNQKVIYNKAPLDGILIHKATSIPIGIEIKNKREWKYPTDQEIWFAIAKCASIEVLPIFITRKLPEVTKFFFKKAGILGLETQFQFIHPCKKHEFKDILNKKYLGYSDIKFTTETRSNLNQFFTVNIPENIEEYYGTFMENKELLFKYATDYRLADKSFEGIARTVSYSKLNSLLPN